MCSGRNTGSKAFRVCSRGVEAHGYRPRDEDVYLMYGRPGRMLGRFTLRDNRTLFLIVFVAGREELTLRWMPRKRCSAISIVRMAGNVARFLANLS
jgi:hypothetical protein